MTVYVVLIKKSCGKLGMLLFFAVKVDIIITTSSATNYHSACLYPLYLIIIYFPKPGSNHLLLKNSSSSIVDFQSFKIHPVYHKASSDPKFYIN